jgi:DNA-binding MarR family transcriptional regulator
MAQFVQDYLLYLLARASAQASREFHARLAKQAISVADWRIMAVLHGTDGFTVGELAKHCLFKQPTLTRAVERLENKGLVVRRNEQNDRRRVLVRLTPEGADLVAGLIEAAAEHESELLKGYSARDARRLKQVLKTLIERTETME